MNLIDRTAYATPLRKLDPAYKAGFSLLVLILCLVLNRPLVGGGGSGLDVDSLHLVCAATSKSDPKSFAGRGRISGVIRRGRGGQHPLLSILFWDNSRRAGFCAAAFYPRPGLCLSDEFSRSYHAVS
ncbi:hypothetical protein [Candidatus Villigracilis vicinus]|uniref:hypothetical protein n=1 Tax=Candidatus Villigracilis vicinus TaxID=3140679 RepID=UPI0031F16860